MPNTYDWIERRLGIDIRNTDRVIPELQHLKVGDEIPMPGYTMRVERLDPGRAMVVRSNPGHRLPCPYRVLRCDGGTMASVLQAAAVARPGRWSQAYRRGREASGLAATRAGGRAAAVFTRRLCR